MVQPKSPTGRTLEGKIGTYTFDLPTRFDSIGFAQNGSYNSKLSGSAFAQICVYRVIDIDSINLAQRRRQVLK